MPFVKIDCGIMFSTLWVDKPGRDLFITALLMAQPYELTESTEQIEVNSLNGTGWSVPPGWYGFVPAAGIGIIDRAGLDRETGLKGLVRLGSPEIDSRTRDFDGRRMVRIDGGYLILNFMKYREKDPTGAERTRRWREKCAQMKSRDGVTRKRDGVTRRRVTSHVTSTEDRVQSPESKSPEVKSKSSVALAPVLPSWNREAAEIWFQEYRGDPPKQYFGSLKGIISKYGWERVRPALVTYLAETPVEYVNIAGKFGAAFGTWEGRASGAPRKGGYQTSGEKSMAAVQRFLARGEVGDIEAGVQQGALEAGDGVPDDDHGRRR